jgi:hypothetical protein
VDTDAGAVNDFRAGGLPLGQLVSDLRGYFVEADPHDSTIRRDFELMWSPLDGEHELRTEPWAPPGAASDQSLSRAVAEFDDWVRQVLAIDKTPDHS